MSNNSASSKELFQKILIDKYSGILEEIQKKQGHLHFLDNYSPILISKQKIKFQEEEEEEDNNNSHIIQTSQNCSYLQQKQIQDQQSNQNSYIDNELNAIFHQAKKNRDFGSSLSLSITQNSIQNSKQLVAGSQNSQRSIRCSRSLHQQSQNEGEFRNDSPEYQFYKHSHSRSRSNKRKNLISDSQITVQKQKESQYYEVQFDKYEQQSRNTNKDMYKIVSQIQIQRQIPIQVNRQVNDELQYTYEKNQINVKNKKKDQQILCQIQQTKNLNDTKDILDNVRIIYDYEDNQQQNQKQNGKSVVFDRSLESNSKHNKDNNKENDGVNHFNLPHLNNSQKMSNQIFCQQRQIIQNQLSQSKQNNDSIIEFDPYLQQSKQASVRQNKQFYKSRTFKTNSQKYLEVEIVLPTEKCNKPPIIYHQNSHNSKENFDQKEKNICSDLLDVKKRLFENKQQIISTGSKITLNIQQKQLFFRLLKKKLIKTAQFYFTKWKKVTVKPKKVIQKLTGIIQLSFKLDEIFSQKVKQNMQAVFQNLKDTSFLRRLNKQTKAKNLLTKILKRKEQRQNLTSLVKYFERWRINMIDYFLVSKHLSRNEYAKSQSSYNQSHFTSQSTQNNGMDRCCSSSAQTFRDQQNSNYVDFGLFCSSNTVNSIQIKPRSESILSFNKSIDSLQNVSQQGSIHIPQFWHSQQQIKYQK